MATRPPVECPLCHDSPGPDRGLEAHLIECHTKRALAQFVVVEANTLEQDASE